MHVTDSAMLRVTKNSRQIAIDPVSDMWQFDSYHWIRSNQLLAKNIHPVGIPDKSSRHQEALSVAGLDPLVHDASEGRAEENIYHEIAV